MVLDVHSVMTTSSSSHRTGREVAGALGASFASLPRVVVTYLTVNHDQAGFLAGMREVLGPEVAVIGCSAQGVVSRGQVREEGFAAGAMALGGDSIEVSHGIVHEIAAQSFDKGRELGRALRRGLSRPPIVTFLYYDPMSGVDIEPFLGGVFSEVECPIVGGAAGHHFNYGKMGRTYQYCGDELASRAAVAFVIAGDIHVEIDSCHGCSPSGVELTVTRAEDNMLCELDGRPAGDVWTEICGPQMPNANQTSGLGIGVPVPDADGAYLVRAAYSIDEKQGRVMVGQSIPTGTRIMLHHRTVEDVLEGAARMGDRLHHALAGRTVRAVLGFECGARTRPFLGDETTLRENLDLQPLIAPQAPWLGMMPWGEIFPILGKPTFHNYSYPLVVLSESP